MFRSLKKVAKAAINNPTVQFVAGATLTAGAMVGAYYLTNSEEDNYQYGLTYGIRAGKHDAMRTTEERQLNLVSNAN